MRLQPQIETRFMWDHIGWYALGFCYFGILCAVAFYGLHRYILVYLYVKHRDKAYTPKAHFEQLPRVTVQLPMFNEDSVA